MAHRLFWPTPALSWKYSCLGNVRLRSRPMLFSWGDVCLRRSEYIASRFKSFDALGRKEGGGHDGFQRRLEEASYDMSCQVMPRRAGGMPC